MNRALKMQMIEEESDLLCDRIGKRSVELDENTYLWTLVSVTNFLENVFVVTKGKLEKEHSMAAVAFEIAMKNVSSSFEAERKKQYISRRRDK